MTLAFIRLHPESADLPPTVSLRPSSRQVQQGALSCQPGLSPPGDAFPRTSQALLKKPSSQRTFRICASGGNRTIPPPGLQPVGKRSWHRCCFSIEDLHPRHPDRVQVACRAGNPLKPPGSPVLRSGADKSSKVRADSTHWNQVRS
jgi:hypothetical protein